MEMASTRKLRNALRLFLGIAAGACFLTPAHAGLILGTNWVVNGDAESGAGSTDGSSVPVPDWTTVGSFPLITAVQYAAAPGNFPAVSDPGPPSRGLNFFAGGNNPTAAGFQSIDVSAFAAQIDAGQLTYALSGYLGGWTNQTDYATFAVIFTNAANTTIGGDDINGPGPADRNNQTGLLFESTTGVIPTNTRSIGFEIQSIRGQGTYDDGYADNVSFVANQSGVGPAPAAPEPGGMALTAIAAIGLCALRRYRRNPV
jgi:hypothetical protein